MTSLFSKLKGFLSSLPSSDRVVIAVLSFGLVASLIFSLFAIEADFLVEMPRRGGEVTEGVIGYPRFINPLLAITDVDRDLTTLTHAGLMGVSSDGTIVPVLAKDYTLSEDGKIYTFSIRDDAFFSDNTPVTANDVVFTVTKAQDPNLKSPEISNWINIRVIALDEKTVQFTLPQPYAPFIEDATLGIVPAHTFNTIKNEELPFSPLMVKPVGAGPFTIKKIYQSKDGLIEKVVLKARDKYVLGRPYIDTITLSFYGQEESLQKALESGKIENAHSIVGDTVVTAPYSRIFGLFFNPDVNPIFTDVAVRKALSIAINREAIIENSLGGYATPVYGPVPSVQNVALTVPDEKWGSLEEAKAILERNGWSMSSTSNVYTHKTKGELAFTIKTSKVPELKILSQALKEVYEQLGARVTVELFEQGDLTQTVIRPREYDALLFGMVIDRGLDLYAFWHSSGRNDPGLNIAGYANLSTDTLLESIRQEISPEQKAADLSKLYTEIATEYPAVFTHTPQFVYTIAKDLRGVSIPHVTTPSDRFSDVHKWYRKTEFVWPIFNNEFWR